MNSNQSSFTNNNQHISELLKPYLKNKKWFGIAIISTLILAFLYIRYTTPQYEVQAKIQILEDQGGNSELSAFRDLEVLTGGNVEVIDELEILNSQTNYIDVVQKLGMNITIFALGNIHDTELYKHAAPFKLNFLVSDSIINQSKTEFYIRINSETSFFYSEDQKKTNKIYSFGNTIRTSIGDMVIVPNKSDLADLIGREYKIYINPVTSVVDSYKAKIKVDFIDEMSNVVTISLKDAVKEKAKDFINSLIETYNRNGVNDKKAVADKTSDFINERIADIYGDLSSVDQSAQEFKSGRGITDVSSQSNINLNLSAANQQELQNANIQLNIASAMKDYVDQPGFEVLPVNVGLSDGSIANTATRYNDLINERNRMLKSSNEKNPIIVNLDQQLSGLKRSLQSSLNSMTNNLNLQVSNLSNRLSQVNARIYAAPGNERALRDITRQQQTTESLYLYLLQKREESQITFASSAPKSKVIDRAYPVSNLPVSPQKPIILLASLILGLFIPFTWIYLTQLFDSKVHNKVTLEKLVGTIPVLAELPKLSKKENTLVRTGERTVLAESLRILRTNLDYVIKSSKINSGKGNLIYVTSSVSGEGKTLISANLAMIFANANKKVLLIGADIRNPKIIQFYSGKNVDRIGKPKTNQSTIGLTEFLSDRSIEISDIITPMLAHDETVDVIYSGKIPPNPAELLMSNRMKELLDAVQTDYDYVIVDTAPMMVVSDTLMISEFADQILYVTRAEVTERKVLEFPLKLHREGKLNGLAFIVNGVKDSNLGYGGSYGYGYGKSTKKWWKF